ncbi:MAG TPA: BON domain-containing protein [Thermoanaerobaculia bacterium]|nr:BON domain-containing protein [Thermoanaerobaculia bacterium]
MNRATTSNRGRFTALFLAAGVLFATGAALASDVDVAVRDRVQQRLVNKDIETVDVAVANGTVTLTGTVDTLRDKQRAEKIADKIAKKNGELVASRIKVYPGMASQADIETGVGNALSNYGYAEVFDWVEANVQGGHVTLNGWVYVSGNRDSIETRVAGIQGVTSIDNHIEILPVSSFDDQIRYQAARRLYGSLGFFDRGGWVNPPIRIVVNRGELYLFGVVHNNAERALARSLVSGSLLAFPVKNHLKTTRELSS